MTVGHAPGRPYDRFKAGEPMLEAMTTEAKGAVATMNEDTSRTSPGLGAIRRRAVDLTQLVETSTIDGNLLPLVVQPAVDGVDLAEWTASNREQVDAYFDKHGAILFRGFSLDGATDFERVAASVASDLFAEYGDLPPEGTSERIYHSTPYPADKMILFHNESSHLPKWPLRQFFFCVIPAEDRGTTPLLDCRLVAERMDPGLLAEFESKGLMYVRNFSPGLDVPWQDFFKTEDRAEVERMCAEEGMTCEWREGDALRISQIGPAVVRHPRTGEKLFFNQVQLHHTYCLDPETRESLRMLFEEEDMPRNVYFGDGTVIPDEVMQTIGDLYEELCVEFPWQSGDLIAVDNMIVAHARRPFSGQRKILVAMGEMVRASDIEAAVAAPAN
jgi:alpha-ketoglutarate-dependent taurine dioxygenase